VGKGERRDALVDLVARLGLQRQVLFAGYRDADLPAVVASLDVFVLLGAGSDESCRAALEAMAAGRPVVAAPVGALPDAVIHEETGLLVDAHPENVAAALERLLANPNERRALGEAGRSRATELFSPERHAAAMEALYLEALAAPRAPLVKVVHLVSCRGWSSDVYWAAQMCREMERAGHEGDAGVSHGEREAGHGAGRARQVSRASRP
jgi:hypothetical protein